MVVSRTGLNDCRNDAACSIEIKPGKRFSDSFAAIAEPGYRFAGWQSGPRHLCGDSLEPCRLENIPGNLPYGVSELELIARFIRDPSFRVLPDHYFYQVAARQELSIALNVQGGDGSPVELSLESFEGESSFDSQLGLLRLRPANVTRVTTTRLHLEAYSGDESSTAEVELTVYPSTPSGDGVTLIGRQKGQGIHLVVLADGYRASQKRTLRIHALQFFEEMLADPGIAEHMAAWNLHVIETPSEQTGADTRFGKNDRDTAFGSGYSCRDIERLICADDAAVMRKLLRDFPHYHQAVVMVNSIEYGGSGGDIAVFNQTNPRIAVHEMGHSFAGLADEYVQENIAHRFRAGYVEGAFANVSRSSTARRVPWRHWIEDPSNPPRETGMSGVGIFEGAYYHRQGYYRPLSTSLMMQISRPFGPVNAEQWISSIYDHLGVTRRTTPEAGSLEVNEGQLQRFTVELALGANVQSVTWLLDGEEVEGSRDHQFLDWRASAGHHAIDLLVDSKSPAVRRNYRDNMQFQRTWQIEVNP